MTTTLVQHEDAAFSDRPVIGGTGLQINCEAGDDGQALTIPATASGTSLHVRFALRNVSATGGRVMPVRLLDADGWQLAAIVFDLDSSQLAVEQIGLASMGLSVSELDRWHVYELALDTIAGTTTIWIDGVVRNSWPSVMSLGNVAQLQVGAPRKDTGLAGEIHFDELIIDDQYVGPVVVEPSSDHPDDPTRWVVLYRLDDADSVAFAYSYHERRGVPLANLVPMDVPGDEVIDVTTYTALVAGITAYLSTNGLESQVIGILIGHGMPGYVDSTGSGLLESLPALLTKRDGQLSYFVNPHASTPTKDNRLTVARLDGTYVTARIDAASLNESIGLLDRSEAIAHEPLEPASSQLWLDPVAGSGASYVTYTDAAWAWADSVAAMRLRLPVIRVTDGGVYDPASFTSISSDGFAWLWSNGTQPTSSFFGSPFGSRVAFTQLDLQHQAESVRQAQSDNWITLALGAGYAAAAASCRAYSSGALADPGRFFGALQQGWTLAEAWFVSQPILREGLYLIGDPLLRCQFPAPGLSLFNVTDGLDAWQTTQPAAMPNQADSPIDLTPALSPSSGQSNWAFAVWYDQQGQPSFPGKLLTVSNNSGELVEALPTFAWPNVNRWRPGQAGGQLTFTAIVDHTVRSLSDIELILQQQDAGTVVTEIFRTRLAPGRQHVQHVQAWPDQAMSYRWSVTDGTSQTISGPWSAVIEQAAAEQSSPIAFGGAG